MGCLVGVNMVWNSRPRVNMHVFKLPFSEMMLQHGPEDGQEEGANCDGQEQAPEKSSGSGVIHRRRVPVLVCSMSSLVVAYYHALIILGHLGNLKAREIESW